MTIFEITSENEAWIKLNNIRVDFTDDYNKVLYSIGKLTSMPNFSLIYNKGYLTNVVKIRINNFKKLIDEFINDKSFYDNNDPYLIAAKHLAKHQLEYIVQFCKNFNIKIERL